MTSNNLNQQKQLQKNTQNLADALKNLCQKHRQHFGLDGAWDEELLNAEKALKEYESIS